MHYFKRLVAKSQRHLLHSRQGPHSPFDDAQGLITGVLLMALGVVFFQSAELVTGGIMGVALLVHYLLDVPLAWTLLLLNIPFYIMGYCRFGLWFAVKSLIAVGLLSLSLLFIPNWLMIDTINPYFAAIAGGLLVGVGLIMLFRHRSSTGGFNVLVLYLQDRLGWNAGLCQLSIDVLVLSSSAFLVSAPLVLASFLGAVMLNLAISMNHRPGRYISF